MFWGMCRTDKISVGRDALIAPERTINHLSQTCKQFVGDDGPYLRQYRIILSADTASEVRQMLSQKRR